MSGMAPARELLLKLNTRSWFNWFKLFPSNPPLRFRNSMTSFVTLPPRHPLTPCHRQKSAPCGHGSALEGSMDDFRARRASGSSALAGESRKKEREKDKSSSNVGNLAGKNSSSMWMKESLKWGKKNKNTKNFYYRLLLVVHRSSANCLLVLACMIWSMTVALPRLSWSFSADCFLSWTSIESIFLCSEAPLLIQMIPIHFQLQDVKSFKVCLLSFHTRPSRVQIPSTWKSPTYPANDSCHKWSRKKQSNRNPSRELHLAATEPRTISLHHQQDASNKQSPLLLAPPWKALSNDGIQWTSIAAGNEYV